MKLYILVLALSSIASSDASNIRGTTNSSSSHTTQTQSQSQEEELELDVVSRCLSYENEDAEEDDDITNMNIALCEDYFSFSLQCNTAFTNDCSTLLSLYVSSDGREPSWPKPYHKQLRPKSSQTSEVAHECNIYTGKKRGHCIAFMVIQSGECCNNKYSKVCVKIRTKLFESYEDEDVVCSSGESSISEWRFTEDSNPYVPWSPM